MEQLDILWKYQELDLLLDQYDQERKNSSLRHKLLKIRNYLVDQEDYLVKLDNDANRKNSQCQKILHECDTISNMLKTQMGKVEAGDIADLAILDELAKEGLVLRDKLLKKDDELKRLVRDLDAFQKKLDDIRQKIAKAKKEYAGVKKDYDKEVAKLQQEQNSVKEKRDALSADIDKALLAKYNNIKINRSPVISELINDQCGGCYMSLASLVVQNVKDRKRIVECENCGRFLYYKS